MQCARHTFERAVDLCGACGEAFCRGCLVYAHGPKKPALCIPCALVASGVRNTASAAHVSKRELKRRRKELADELARPATLADALRMPDLELPAELETGTQAARPGSGPGGRGIEWCA